MRLHLIETESEFMVGPKVEGAQIGIFVLDQIYY